MKATLRTEAQRLKDIGRDRRLMKEPNFLFLVQEAIMTISREYGGRAVKRAEIVHQVGRWLGMTSCDDEWHLLPRKVERALQSHRAVGALVLTTGRGAGWRIP